MDKLSVHDFLKRLNQETLHIIELLQSELNDEELEQVEQRLVLREQLLLEMNEQHDLTQLDIFAQRQVQILRENEQTAMGLMRSVYAQAKSNYAQSKNRNKVMNKYEDSGGFTGYFMDREY